jgi:hypothetical protein
VAAGTPSNDLRYEPPTQGDGTGHVGLPGPDRKFGTPDDERFYFNEHGIGVAGAAATVSATPNSKQSITTPTGPTFGPVIEREVAADLAIDFDTGKLGHSMPYFTPPLSLQGTESSESSVKNISWELDAGMDVVPGDSGHFIGFDLKAEVLESDAWEKLTASEVRQRLIHTYRQTSQPLNLGEERPAPCAFQTREGGMGILQIISSTKASVKLRYKLVQDGTAKAAAPVKPAAKGTPKENVFTDVIERSLDKDCMIDFDIEGPSPMAVLKMADLKQPGPGLHPDAVNALRAEEMAKLGMDALFSDGKFAAFSMRTGELPSGDWGHLGSDILKKIADDLPPAGPPQILFENGRKGPATYAFRTREGRNGILQIMSATDSAVKIRYTLEEASDPIVLTTSIWLAEAPVDFKPTAENMDRDILIRSSRKPKEPRLSHSSNLFFLISGQEAAEAELKAPAEAQEAPLLGASPVGLSVRVLPVLNGNRVRFSLNTSVSEFQPPKGTKTQQLVIADTVKLDEIAVFDLGVIDAGHRRVGAIRFSKADVVPRPAAGPGASVAPKSALPAAVKAFKPIPAEAVTILDSLQTIAEKSASHLDDPVALVALNDERVAKQKKLRALIQGTEAQPLMDRMVEVSNEPSKSGGVKELKELEQKIEKAIHQAVPKTGELSVPVRYMEAAKAWELSLASHPEGKAAFIRIDDEHNTIVLNAAGTGLADLRKTLSEIDQHAASVVLNCILVEVTSNPGEKGKIISRPTIHMLEGQHIPFTHDLADGRRIQFDIAVGKKIRTDADGPATFEFTGEVTETSIKKTGRADWKSPLPQVTTTAGDEVDFTRWLEKGRELKLFITPTLSADEPVMLAMDVCLTSVAPNPSPEELLRLLETRGTRQFFSILHEKEKAAAPAVFLNTGQNPVNLVGHNFNFTVPVCPVVDGDSVRFTVNVGGRNLNSSEGKEDEPRVETHTVKMGAVEAFDLRESEGNLRDILIIRFTKVNAKMPGMQRRIPDLPK